ncbi:ALG3-domain-containing protein, partial [Martensiomyces pterosporus]
YWAIAAALMALDFLLNLAIIRRVPYTEIDWRAYMQEVKGVVDGERNYLNLKGDTGPLVYPAGFVWIYGVLWKLTSGGADVRLAQYIFMGVYMVHLALVIAIYKKSQAFPPVLLVLLALSKRTHSIFVLRLFNDPVAMLFAYLAIYALLSARSQRWSGFLLSLGIAVKMNVLLLVPGAAYIWWRIGGLPYALCQLAAIVCSQLLVAAPFLAAHPAEYLSRAFELGREFTFRWTVNWRFVGEPVFLSQGWARSLLAAHLALLAVLALGVWPRLSNNTALSVIKRGLGRSNWTRAAKNSVHADEILTVLFTSNLVGVVCARSLHYQFYSWYFHMLPYLLFKSCLPAAIQIAVWGAIEYSWNVYPSTNFSSALL